MTSITEKVAPAQLREDDTVEISHLTDGLRVVDKRHKISKVESNGRGRYRIEFHDGEYRWYGARDKIARVNP